MTDDFIEAPEARELLKARCDRTWESWHQRGIIPYFVAPGTNRRLYSRRALIEWVTSGARGGAQ